MAEINQKEYLKKYLSIGKEPGKKKKRKRKGTAISDRIKIIDDDIDEAIFNKAVEDDLYGMSEDAPQIVGVVDDRPLELRIDDYRKSDKWKPVGTQDTLNSNINLDVADQAGRVKERQLKEHDTDSLSPERYKINDNLTNRRRYSRDDSSPMRRSRSKDLSPPRFSRTSDLSPPRSKRGTDASPSRSRHSTKDDGSIHNMRRDIERTTLDRSKRDNYKDFKYFTECNRNRDEHSLIYSKDDKDYSPARRNKTNSDDGARRNRVLDLNVTEQILPQLKKPERDISPQRKRKISENSCGRYKKDNNASPIRKSRKSEFSPCRRNHHRDSDTSPLGKHTKDGKSFSNKNESNSSSSGKDKKDNGLGIPKRSRSRWDSGPSTQAAEENYSSSTEHSTSSKKDNANETKMTKTLDGKTAGLQKANELVKETQALRRREDEVFKTMPAEVSGQNATAVVRDRKTGKIRDLKKETEEEKKKKEKEAENKEKYAKWGKGLKQVEEYNEKISSDLYEMSKPLARYADDEDLERHLKEQEREGDPMLAYIRKKKRKKEIISGKPTKPQFEGEFMPNRYGIRPGHRWDGVDRSSGYEKKWFEVLNSRRAQQEDVYKWSTEDM